MNRPNRSHQVAIAAILLFFTGLGLLRHLHQNGDDLSSSYIGCRLVAEGQEAHLFAHEPVFFDQEKDPAWIRSAVAGSFSEGGRLHPYVQTPLWAWSLQPLCEHTSFPFFSRIFVLLIMVCLSATVWLAARYWTMHLFNPAWIALVCVGLYRTQPLRYALFLIQTHVLFLFLAVVAVILAKRDKPVVAGILLALAAAVKITPGFLVVYWLFAGRRKAALSFIVSSAVLLLGTIFAVGQPTMLAYLHEVQWLSNVGLVSFNNQSLAAVWMGHHASHSELFHWRIYQVPVFLKVAGIALSFAASIFGGLIDRESKSADLAPYGAAICMIGTTLAAPIAWSHYFLLLLLPTMFLLDRAIDDYAERSFRLVAAWLILLAAIVVLNLYPVSFQDTLQGFRSWSIVRSQFDSALVALIALVSLRFAPGAAKWNASDAGRLMGRRPEMAPEDIVYVPR